MSEGPEERLKLTAEIKAVLEAAGVHDADVEVLCAYKQGYSWLMDSVAPALAGKQVSKLTIEFAPYGDPLKESAMRTAERWVQELYPVDEMLAAKLKMPLANITLAKLANDAGPTYRVHAFTADGREILTPRLYRASLRQAVLEGVQRLRADRCGDRMADALRRGRRRSASERIATDLEEFWDHYQNETLPKIYNMVLAQNNGKPKLEYQPLFDTIKIDFHMSEPDYQLGLDQERISSLEGLQEDLLFATQNGFYIFGNTFSTGLMDYMGRILPVAHLSEDGQDSHVRIEFYAKDAAHPRV